MKYSVDRISGDIAVIQNLETCEIVEIEKYNLPDDIKETDILVFDGNSYIKSEEETKSRLDIIREKMEKLRSKE